MFSLGFFTLMSIGKVKFEIPKKNLEKASVEFGFQPNHFCRINGELEKCMKI